MSALSSSASPTCGLTGFRFHWRDENDNEDEDVDKGGHNYDDYGENGGEWTTMLSQRNSATGQGELTEIQQKNQPTEQNKPLDNEGTRMLHSPKRTHFEAGKTVGASIEAQTLNAAAPPSAQSLSVRTPSTASSDHNGQCSQHERPIPSTSEMTMDTRKQNNTILWVSIPCSNDAVPLKLRSCMTMSSLFDSVLKICGLTKQQDMVLGLRIDLKRGVNYIGTYKSFILKREFSESFEAFLEILDAAPCWKVEGGHCAVAVDVVMAQTNSRNDRYD